MKQDQKELELEQFLEKQKEQRLDRAEQAAGEGAAGDQEIMWDGFEAAATLGSAADRKEVATNIIASDAFAHLTDDIQAPIPKPEVDDEPAEGMVSDFEADTAIAFGMIEGEANPSDPDGFIGEAATRKPTEDEDVFGGGGGKPPDDDDTPVDVSEVGEPDVGETSKKKRKKKKDKGSSKQDSGSAKKPAPATKPDEKKPKRSWFKKKP